MLDRTPERTLFVVHKKNTILLSGTCPPDEDLKSAFSEIAFSLLEAGLKPVKVVVCGAPDAEVREAAKVFEIPVGLHESGRFDGSHLPATLSGARRWGAYPAISLLPSDRKLEVRSRRQKELIKGSLRAFGVFLACFTLLAGSHLMSLKHKKSALQKQSAKLAPEVAEARQIAASLAAIQEAERSRRGFLLLLKELAERVPPSVRLKELRMEGGNIVLQGESPSHAFLTETVQAFEGIKEVKDAKLEHARTRKRLNEDYFDFEVSAKWQL